MLQPGWEWDWGELMHIYIWLTLCCSPETITALLISYTPIQDKMLQNNNNNTARKKKKSLIEREQICGYQRQSVGGRVIG